LDTRKMNAIFIFVLLHLIVELSAATNIVFGSKKGSWFKKRWNIVQMNLETNNSTILLDYDIGPNGQGSLMGFCAMKGKIFWGDSSSNCLYGFQNVQEEIKCGLNEPQGLFCSNETYPNLYLIDSGQHYGTGVTSILKIDVNSKSILTLSSNADDSGCFDPTGEPRGIFVQNDEIYLSSDWSLWTLGNRTKSCAEEKRFLGPGDVPNLDGEPIIAESLAVVGDDVWFTRFYGGIYIQSNKKVSQYAETNYGTFGINFINATNFLVTSIMDDKDTKLLLFDLETKTNLTITTSIQSAGVAIL